LERLLHTQIRYISIFVCKKTCNTTTRPAAARRARAEACAALAGPGVPSSVEFAVVTRTKCLSSAAARRALVATKLHGYTKPRRAQAALLWSSRRPRVDMLSATSS
jgi:hypothetical protein